MIAHRQDFCSLNLILASAASLVAEEPVAVVAKAVAVVAVVVVWR